MVATLAAWATHIVGGELNLQYTNQGYRFVLSVNLYFDDINGEQDAEDEEVFVAVFSKRSNRRVATFTLPRVASAQVNYTNAACSNGRLQTRQIQYSTEIILDANIYNEAEGYYFSWERCCRNESIVNITNPGDNGMVFYMEFPAVMLTGNRVVNSSPAFPMPKGDYACVNEPFYFDFGATDADGDQLKYSLITPKRGTSNARNTPFGPGPHPGVRGQFYPAPYPIVSWANGFSVANMIAGPQPLQVNATTGQITFTTNRVGLYVFSVLCEEYRNGEKIGAVQRDFQLLVIDCPKNDAPVILAKEVNALAVYQEGETISLSYGGQPCIDLLVTDPNRNSTLHVAVNALNFSGQDITVLTSQGVVNGAADTLRSRICFNTCIAHTKEDPLLLQVIASDNGCPIPKRDTLLLRVYIEPVPTNAPQVTTTLVSNVATIQAGQTIRFDVIASDPDNDLINLYALGVGFSLTEAGMEFVNSSGLGKIMQPFTWTPGCEVTENNSAFVIHFITEDNSCSPNRFDTVTVNLEVENFELLLSRFTPPNVFTPNEDGTNDTFVIPDLPPDNCQYTFKSIEIYNRWGRPVYTAYEREFTWSGQEYPTGSYFYLINYGATVFKGTVSLLR
ncbi:gliding motility-associated C-terminal domain-containing protein [Rhodocytophaga aerolata]|nr:gliding motility-associated C-terminal domain-containing protein [Rhodocytophaga aerolata]